MQKEMAKVEQQKQKKQPKKRKKGGMGWSRKRRNPRTPKNQNPVMITVDEKVTSSSSTIIDGSDQVQAEVKFVSVANSFKFRCPPKVITTASGAKLLPDSNFWPVPFLKHGRATGCACKYCTVRYRHFGHSKENPKSTSFFIAVFDV